MRKDWKDGYRLFGALVGGLRWRFTVRCYVVVG